MSTPKSTRPEEPTQFMRPNDVIRETGLSRTLVYELLATGELPSIQVRRTRLIPREDFNQFCDARRTKPVERATA